MITLTHTNFTDVTTTRRVTNDSTDYTTSPTISKQDFKFELNNSTKNKKVDTLKIIQFAYKYGFRALIPIKTDWDKGIGKRPLDGCSVKDPKWTYYEWIITDHKTNKERLLKHNENMNMGIIIPKNKIVIDIDNQSKSKGGNGVKFFTTLLKRNTIYSTIEEYCLNDGISYTLTPSKGYHLWFNIQDNFYDKILSTFKNCDTIDIKKEGEYIICPLSKSMGCCEVYNSDGTINNKPHKCGRTYNNCLYKGNLYEPFWVEKPDTKDLTNEELSKLKPLFIDIPDWIKKEFVDFDYIITNFKSLNEESKFQTNDIYDDRVEKFAELCEPIWNSGDYNEWIVLIWTIKELLGEDGRELVHRLSKLDIKQYTQKQTDFIFDNGNPGHFTLGTLRYFAKRSNLKEYEKICKEYYKSDKTYLQSKKKNKTKEKIINDSCVIDDDYASKVFISLIGSKLKKHEDDLYFFDETTGLWEKNDAKKNTAYFKAITKYKEQLIFKVKDEEENVVLTINYGGIKKKAIDMLSYINAAIPKTNFLDRIDTSIGKLLFLDGIYDFRTDTFTPGFDENIIFLNRITRNFPKERNEDKINYVYQTLFQKPFDQNEQTIKAGDYLLHSITMGIYGDYTIKKFIFSFGEGNSGKGMLVTALKAAFGKYIGEFNGNQLLIKDGSDDFSKDLSWLVYLEGTRIAFSNECKMNTKGIDGNTIKKIASGGDSHDVRLLYENQRELVCKSLLFFLCNDIPKITPWDSGVDERVKIASYTRQFLSYEECTKKEDGSIDESNGISLKDENIKNDFKNNVEVQDALIYLIIDTFKKIYKPRVLNKVKLVWNIDTPDCVKQSTKERKMENKGGCNTLKEAIELRFEFTNNKEDKVAFEMLENHLKENG